MKRPMKVLMTADTVGGVWTYAMDLCRGLARHDIQVVLATLGPPPTTAQRRVAQSLPNVRLRIAGWKLEWMDDPWLDVEQAGAWLLEIARHERVDLVHVNGYAHAALPFGLPLVCVAHSCVCSWWRAVHDTPAPREWQQYQRSVAAGLDASHIVVAPTHAFLQSLRSLYGPLPHARVVYNGRDCARLRRGALHRSRAPVVLACGRAWDAAKNLAVLDAAAARLQRDWDTDDRSPSDILVSNPRSRGWQVVVAGETVSPDGRRCELRAVRCLGALHARSIRRWMRRAPIYAHPALYEPFGLSVVEAASEGCALVLSDVPSLRELWEGAALFASPRDPQAWHVRMLELIECPQRRRELARAAWKRAARFSARRMCAEYAAVYAQLVGSSAPPEPAFA